jgi:predicted Fe-S protein YdhL (DUF1289 family)
VPSPCVAVCRIDPATGQCEGCARTLDEISDWLIFDAPERLIVWQRICDDFGVPLERALAGKMGATRAQALLAWHREFAGAKPPFEDQ